MDNQTKNKLIVVVKKIFFKFTFKRHNNESMHFLGDRAFPAAAPGLKNSLPSNLWQSDLNLQQFRWVLKTYLFGWLRLRHLRVVTFCL